MYNTCSAVSDANFPLFIKLPSATDNLVVHSRESERASERETERATQRERERERERGRSKARARISDANVPLFVKFPSATDNLVVSFRS